MFCSITQYLQQLHTGTFGVYLLDGSSMKFRLFFEYCPIWLRIDTHFSQVLGAAMFYAKVGDAALVYTGDYNMVPDRHLGAAQIDRLQLDLVISE